ncbi:SLC13 family permease [Vibrio azureus]|uniref:SLC13 family permease n=1 Tax=Vibrio azureus TaxID=512649 RepID=UPI003AB37ECF
MNVSNSISNEERRSLSFFSLQNLIIVADIILAFCLYNFLPLEQPIVLGITMLVFIAILWLTEAVHVTVTAILIPIIAVLAGVFDTPTALNNFSSPIVFLFLAGFAMAAAMQGQGLDKIIANQILVLSRGKMAAATLFMFGTTAVLSMWISNIATTAIMMPMALGMLSKVDIEKERSTYTFVLLGIAYSASIGGIATVVGCAPNAIAASAAKLGFSEWFSFGGPTVMMLLPAAIVLLYITFKPNLNDTFEIDNQPVEWNQGKLITVGIFLFTVVSWIFSKPLNAMLGDIAKLDTIIALIAIVAIVITRVASWKDIEKTADWGVLLLFGGGICLSNVLKTTGTSAFLANSLSEFVMNFGVIGMIVMIISFVVVLTEFASNTASAALLIPLFGGIAESLGLSPVVMSVLIGIAASCAFMLPVATPPNAIVYGTGFIKQNEMMRVGAIVNTVAIMILSVLVLNIWI